jgi:arsenate reductase
VKKQSVLFVCIHNSGRSQMAEAFLRKFGSDRFEAESAGLEPGKLNPIVVASMKEAGVDISQAKTKSVFDMLKSGRRFDVVVTVCDEAAAERCPVFPGQVSARLHWGFRDPAAFQGTEQEKIAQTREVRDEIANKIQEFVRGGVDAKR